MDRDLINRSASHLNQQFRVVGRSFAWTTHFRRLVRDYERLPEALARLHFLAFAIPMLKRVVMLPVHSAQHTLAWDYLVMGAILGVEYPTS